MFSFFAYLSESSLECVRWRDNSEVFTPFLKYHVLGQFLHLAPLGSLSKNFHTSDGIAKIKDILRLRKEVETKEMEIEVLNRKKKVKYANF